jgi:hypothetical protein
MNSLIDTPTDCPRCFGTRFEKPTRRESRSCREGCNIEQDTDAEKQWGSKPVWGGTTHVQVLVKTDRYVAWVDKEMAPVILALWEANQLTWVSCQGPIDPYVAVITPCDRDVVKKILHDHGWYVIGVESRKDVNDIIFRLTKTREIIG